LSKRLIKQSTEFNYSYTPNTANLPPVRDWLSNLQSSIIHILLILQTYQRDSKEKQNQTILIWV
jgi:hypothetical protein